MPRVHTNCAGLKLQTLTMMPPLDKEYENDNICRILALDGGGAKGFYTLGVLKEIEATLGCPLYKRFNLIFGTSTGAIIAALLALGHEVEDIRALYERHVPAVMAQTTAAARTAVLTRLSREVFGDRSFTDVKTGIGIVATNWLLERPMIFKNEKTQAHGMVATFVPGFGVSIADAVEGSCSAYPFFDKKSVTTSQGHQIVLVDGGYCANNPTLYAIADATAALGKDRKDIRVVNVGVGVYPERKPSVFSKMFYFKKMKSVQLLQKTLEVNTQSMDQLRAVLFKDIDTIRISDTFERPEMATDLMESDLAKLNILRQRGRESFASREPQLRAMLT